MEQFGDSVFYARSAKDFPVRDRHIVEVDADSQISDAFATLLTHNLTCAPVWDQQQSGYLGFFDINDALSISYDVDLVAQATGDTDLVKTQMRTTAVKVFEIFNKANNIRNPELEAPWIPVGNLTPMKNVIPVLGSGRARRVPVVDPSTGKIIKVISQMDIVRQLHLLFGSQREKGWPQIFLQTPANTGLGLHPVVTVTENDEAREAFRKMIDEKVSCVGVVDEAAKLIGCIANKDIQVVMRGMQSAAPQRVIAPMMAQSSRAKGRFSIAASMTSNQDFFGMPAMMFVSEVRRETERGGRTHVAVCEASPDTTFKDIIAKINATGHHRVFLVDETHTPLGLISVADICALVHGELLASTISETKRAPPPVPKRSTAEGQ